MFSHLLRLDTVPFRSISQNFSGKCFNENEVKKVILNMDEKNEPNWKMANLSITNWWCSCGIMKGRVGSYISILTKILNSSWEIGYFSNQLKLAEVAPVFKKEDKLSKKIIAQLVFFRAYLRYLKK